MGSNPNCKVTFLYDRFIHSIITVLLCFDSLWIFEYIKSSLNISDTETFWKFKKVYFLKTLEFSFTKHYRNMCYILLYFARIAKSQHDILHPVQFFKRNKIV